MKIAFFSHSKYSGWIYPALLVVGVLAVYFPVLGHDFQYQWDDQWIVMNHYTESGLNWHNLWETLTEFHQGQYAPLNETLYIIIYTAFGYEPFWFHLASLLLHAANACLVFVCISRLLEINRRFEIKRRHTVAFFTALLFAVHPFNVEPVAWISASKILVYSFYYLLATCAFLSFLKQGKLKYYFLTLFLFVCSFLGKEQAVTFPLWMLLIYWLAGYNFKEKKIWFAVSPFLVLAFVFGIITFLSQATGKSLFEAEYPVWQRLVYACYTFTEYALKSVLPFKLSYLYPFTSHPGEPLPQWLLIYPLLLAVLLVAFWKQIVSHKIWLFCLLFFGIHIAVALHIISLSRFTVVADRYAYMATVGVCLMVAYYGDYFARKWKRLSKSDPDSGIGQLFALLWGVCEYAQSRMVRFGYVEKGSTGFTERKSWRTNQWSDEPFTPFSSLTSWRAEIHKK